jgi:penicillin-binding protein 2
LQLARALSGIASGGVLRRPHIVFPDEVPAQELSAIHETFPGSGDATIPLFPENWQIITDGMAQATTPGQFNTAGASHLEGIDFAGKTGTAQVMSHDALARSGGGHHTVPNAWFVGMAPRRNPDIVVAVLWQNGDWGSNSARLGAQVIDAFVNKQRKRENNVRIAETPKVETTTASAVIPIPSATPPINPKLQ